ncbi:MAG: bifunctional DNA primase/polymerase [Thermoguttaceae bacterium]|jgi:hypothetical protein
MNDRIYCKVYPNAKVPVGTAWGKRPLTWDEIIAARTGNLNMNVGLVFGPTSGLLDCECDDLGATESFNILFGKILTPHWQSKRGQHHIFLFDSRLAELPNVIHYCGVEFRLGTNGQTQSVCPPSIVDGVKREWIVSPDLCPFAPLPEHVIAGLLETTPAPKKTEYDPADLPELKNKSVQRLLKYCKSRGLEVLEVRQ